MKNLELINCLSQFGEVVPNFSFKKLTTLKIGGNGTALIYPHNVFGLLSLLQYCQEHDIKTKVLGFGSNILASDRYFDGVVIKLNKTFSDVYFIGDLVFVQSGASLVTLAQNCMKQSLSGLEWAAGIPATVGGAVFMNAGAYKSCMSDVIDRVLVLKDNKIEYFSWKECHFSYRHSIFQNHPEWIILGCVLKLNFADKDEINQLMKDRQLRRIQTQPLDYPSCGSVFRNPSEQLQAWKLIEDCGLRGRQIGGCRVSEKHCNFLINAGTATAEDMVQLIEECQHYVSAKFDIDLVLEVERFNW